MVVKTLTTEHWHANCKDTMALNLSLPISDAAQPAAVAVVPGGARRGRGGGEREGRAGGQPQGDPRPLLPAVALQAAAETTADAAATGEGTGQSMQSIQLVPCSLTCGSHTTVKSVGSKHM